MNVTVPAAPTSRAALWGALGLSLALALLVCTDPFATNFIHFHWLEYFPFEWTACVFVTLAFLAFLAANTEAIWTHRDVIVCASMFAAAQMIGLNLLKLDPLEMVSVPVALLWAAMILSGQLPSVRTSGTLLLMGFFLFWCFPTLYHAFVVPTLATTAALIVKFLDYFFLTQFIRTRRAIRLAINAFMAVSVGSSIIGIVQVSLYMATGIVFTVADTTENLFKPTPFGLMLRATALCPKPQHLAGFLLFGMPMLAFALFEPGRSKWGRFWIGLGLVLTCTAIFLTLAVGAWIAESLIAIVFLYARWPSRAIHITCILTLILLAGWLSGFYQWIYYTYLAHSGILRGNEQRLFLLELAMEKIGRNPLIGVGPRQFYRFDGNYRQFPVHNAYFQAATEAGLVGGFLYIAILGYDFVRLIYLCSTATDPAEKRLCRMLLLSLFALFWNGMSEPVYDHSNTWVSLGLLEAAILTLMARPRRALAPSAVAVAAG